MSAFTAGCFSNNIPVFFSLLITEKINMTPADVELNSKLLNFENYTKWTTIFFLKKCYFKFFACMLLIFINFILVCIENLIQIPICFLKGFHFEPSHRQTIRTLSVWRMVPGWTRILLRDFTKTDKLKWTFVWGNFIWDTNLFSFTIKTQKKFHFFFLDW